MECSGDELNLVHVIERPPPPEAHHGAPPVDFLPQPAPVPQEQVVDTAKAFLQERFGRQLQELEPHPVVHIITVRASLCMVIMYMMPRAWPSARMLQIMTPRAQAVLRLSQRTLASPWQNSIHHALHKYSTR